MKMNIFIMFHKNIYPAFYENDPLFSKEYYTFLKTDGNFPNVDTSPIPVVNATELTGYKELGKSFAEYQGIYNIARHPELFVDLDYIGFTQYDKPNKFRGEDRFNVTEEILKLVGDNNHISFETYLFDKDYGQSILMDLDKPNLLIGDGKNVYDVIIEDYNSLNQTSYTLADLKGKKLNLCSSFILPVPVFMRVMRFIKIIIEIKDFTPFTAKGNMPAGFLERYMAVAIAFQNLNLIDLSTEHLDLKNQQ